MSVIFETKWKKALTSILEQLSPPELRKLMSNLDKIPQGRKAEKHREEFPDIIIQVYGTEGSISVTDKEMKVLQRNDAKVQEPLKRFVKELKERRQKIKEAAKKPATESGSVAKKPKPAAGTSSKPASSASGSASAAKEPKPAAGLKSCQPDKKKTTSQLPAQSSNERKRKMDPVGAMKTKPKTESTKTTKTTKMDPVGAKKPKQKTEQQESLSLSSASLKPAESTKTSKVQSDAVQTGRIKIIRIKSSNTKNTHLEVEFNGKPQTFFVTTRLLADAFGFKVEDDFTETLSRKMLTAEVQIQGNKITKIKKL